jgi:hypothetical protein
VIRKSADLKVREHRCCVVKRHIRSCARAQTSKCRRASWVFSGSYFSVPESPRSLVLCGQTTHGGLRSCATELASRTCLRNRYWDHEVTRGRRSAVAWERNPIRCRGAISALIKQKEGHHIHGAPWLTLRLICDILRCPRRVGILAPHCGKHAASLNQLS